jgi:hypothetical protein
MGAAGLWWEGRFPKQDPYLASSFLPVSPRAGPES